MVKSVRNVKDLIEQYHLFVSAKKDTLMQIFQTVKNVGTSVKNVTIE